MTPSSPSNSVSGHKGLHSLLDPRDKDKQSLSLSALSNTTNPGLKSSGGGGSQQDKDGKGLCQWSSHPQKGSSIPVGRLTGFAR